MVVATGGQTDRSVRCVGVRLLSGLLTALLDIWDEVPVEKLQLKIYNSAPFCSWAQSFKKGRKVVCRPGRGPTLISFAE